MLYQIKKNKKALSEMLAYVLLVVIAVSLSFVVYAWVKGYIPVAEVKCPDGTSLILSDYICDENEKMFNFTLENKGRFNVSGFIARYSNEPGLAVKPLDIKDADAFEGEIFFNSPLPPGEIVNYRANYKTASGNDKIVLIEIEPIRIINNKVILCKDKVTTQEIKNCE